MKFFISILLLILSAPTMWAKQKEPLGSLAVHSVLLKPEVQVTEPFEANISLGDSMASLSWSNESQFQAIFTLGPERLLNPSLLYIATDSDLEELALIEAYAQYDTGYGQLLLGQMPILYGLQGSRNESETDIQRPLFYQKGFLALRDHALGFLIKDRSFVTRFFVHNGESKNHQDGRVWVTGTWGIETLGGHKLGFMGTTGTTKPLATANSQINYAGFDNSLESKWRVGGLYYGLDTSSLFFGFEAQVGQVIQEEEEKNNFLTGHFQFNYSFNPYWGIVSRYDYWDPNDDEKDDSLTQVTLGFRISDKYRSSSFYIVGIKNIEEDKDIANDELRLVWRLTPMSNY